MPADRRKKTKTPEAVPDAGDPDRKRVLNVLAQRRYRQKRKEKIAALEAQASGLSLQQSSNPSDDGGVRIEPDHTSSSSSGYSPDNFDLIEDIIRQPEVDAFPDLNFGQDQVDLQLFPGLGKCINQLCRLEILCTCMIANLLQKAARAKPLRISFAGCGVITLTWYRPMLPIHSHPGITSIAGQPPGATALEHLSTKPRRRTARHPYSDRHEGLRQYRDSSQPHEPHLGPDIPTRPSNNFLHASSTKPTPHSRSNDSATSSPPGCYTMAFSAGEADLHFGITLSPTPTRCTRRRCDESRPEQGCNAPHSGL
jgi:hypothetical protein